MCELTFGLTDIDRWARFSGDYNPIHFDAHYAAQTEFGRPLVNSTLTLAVITGLSVGDISRYAVNLGWDEVRLSNPLFEGDTVYSRSEVLEKRESKSRPNVGIVKFKTTGYKQDGSVIIEIKRTAMIYKRGHVPEDHRPKPNVTAKDAKDAEVTIEDQKSKPLPQMNKDQHR